MVDAQHAVRAAREYLHSLYDAAELPHFRLEELELSEDERQWLVTFGWDDAAVTVPAAASPEASWLRQIQQQRAPTPQRLPRLYKRVVVDAETGAVAALRIRNVG